MESLQPPPIGLGKDTEGNDAQESKPKKRKSKSKKGSKAKKRKGTSTRDKEIPQPDPPAHDEHGEDMDEILNTFNESYRGIIKMLPPSLRPCSSRHGEHSYTVFLCLMAMLNMRQS